MQLQKFLVQEEQESVELAGQKIPVEKGVFWMQKQRQGHSRHYIVPYRACFAPQIPAFFIKQYSEKGDKVLDPFCGRGTTILEANVLGRVGIGFDISPLALSLAESKLHNVTLEQVSKRLKEIDFSKKNYEDYEKFKDIYHKDTYSQILALKYQLKDNNVDNFIKSIVLGRLHGHSPSFFSVFTFNVISPSIERIKSQSEKHGAGKAEFRDIIPRIIKKAETVLRDRVPEVPGSKVELANSTNLNLKNNEIDLIVTSPPFLDVVNYIDDNWLRFWFLGYDRKKLEGRLIQTPNLQEYKQFILNSMKEMNRVLRKGKYCIIEVGDVMHKSKKLNLDEVIVDLAPKAGFKVEKVLINYISAPKIANAFSNGAKHKGVKTNRCVVMKKL